MTACSIPRIKGEPPFILAVSGHRKIVSVYLETIRKQTAKILLQIGKNSQNRFSAVDGKGSRPSVIVLSDLAGGADPLVAEEVLKLKRESPELNVHLAAVLPMPPVFYQHDFSEGSTRDYFLQLFNDADFRVVLPLLPECQNCTTNIVRKNYPAI